jgi:tellurite resistance protein
VNEPPEISANSDATLRAIAAAYAYVACADGSYDHRESSRFEGLLKELPGLAQESMVRAQSYLSDFVRGFQLDFAEGLETAESAVHQLRGEKGLGQLVLRAAQVALISDGRLVQVEENALRRICEALDMEEGAGGGDVPHR